MELWIPITVGAAFLQNVRSSLQRHLKQHVGTTGATFVRFGFGLPFAALYLFALTRLSGNPLPAPSPAFLAWTGLGALGQVAATFLLIHLFSFRNFTVGTAYSRTEPAQAALFGLVFLGEVVGPLTLVAIAVSMVGVMLISVARGTFTALALVSSVFTRTAGIGILSGSLFGVAAVAYRAASLSLGHPGFAIQAATTLLWAIALQTAVMLAWMVWRDRAGLAQVRAAWKVSALVGFVGATASFGWFAAMTLQQAAVVKALAQVEMIFAFATSILFFREHVNRLEIAGCVLIVAGILALVFGG
ncbi:DMT family transporter [Oricola thermophila]|uniref:DMT family transporter n=1 Tax=Oricola thermophila TaxID=2742145 RepID=A0A6N1VEN4_9HYPH|nr:DMT family transporter [Oricola thermophila]QKV19416.1 DMT family transporter [Oricola thermophila]